MFTNHVLYYAYELEALLLEEQGLILHGQNMTRYRG